MGRPHRRRFSKPIQSGPTHRGLVVLHRLGATQVAASKESAKITRASQERYRQSDGSAMSNPTDGSGQGTSVATASTAAASCSTSVAQSSGDGSDSLAWKSRKRSHDGGVVQIRHRPSPAGDEAKDPWKHHWNAGPNRRIGDTSTMRDSHRIVVVANRWRERGPRLPVRRLRLALP
jgi:hypothetical protein